MKGVTTMSPRSKFHRSVRSAAAASILSIVSGALLVLPLAPAQAAIQAIDLYAVTGTTTLPNGVSLPVWGYSSTGAAVTAPGGPTIAVTEGDTVTVTLHNALGEKTALFFQGQEMPLDRTGANAAGGTRSYTFTASHAGTFLYEAGPVLKTGPADVDGTGTQYQTAMGLHGALVVRPAAAGQAYDAASSYDDDAVLVLSEIDPALNTASNRARFDMRTYVPRYSLINGRAYPATAPIVTSGGRTVLLRYVNAGVNYHSMGVLGASQKVVGMDGSKLDFPRTYVAQTFGPGESADALVTVPGAAATTTSLTVYDASQSLTNRMAGGVGGMLTTVDVPGSGAAGDVTGPVTSQVGLLSGNLSAHVDDASRGGSNISAVEYFLDTVGAPGTGAPMTSGGSPTEDASVPVSLPDGEHVLYVRGRDAAANWGPLSSVLVTGADAGGPTASGTTLSPRLVRHDGGAVRISATGDDSASGNSNVVAAEYFLNTLGADGDGVVMTVNQQAPVASLDGTIDQAAVNGLPEGHHSVYVHAKDAQGNWGDALDATLDIDTTVPLVTGGAGLFVSPNPTNGLVPFSNGTNSIRLNATQLIDPASNGVQSPIAAAEMFIDTVGALGAGIPLRAVDGSFSDPEEGGYADIPLTTVRALGSGGHTISVRAKDAAGNWGLVATMSLVVDKSGPVLSSPSASPSPTRGARSVTLTATATDATSVAAAEFFLGADPGVGNGTPMTVGGTGPWTASGTFDTSVLPEGTATVKVRAKDAAGNWGATITIAVPVTAPLSFSTLSTSAGRNANNVYRWDGAAMTPAPVYTGPANVDGYAVVDATHVYLSFSANASLAPPTGPSFTAADEDVVSYNPTTQRYTMVFDGSTNGLGGNGANVDAVSVAAGKLYYSVNGTARPTGVSLPAGAANDIYRYDGTGVTGSSTRVVDASAAPYSMPSSDVDGLKIVDATHFYVSFSPTTTTLPGLGNVEDEDVVAYNAGRWSVYFDGTSKGLTAAASDVDAFDLP